jgi:hypothetical protein
VKIPNNFHWLRLITVVVLFILVGIMTFNKDQAKDVIKSAFDSGFAPGIVWTYVVVAVLSKKIFVDKSTQHFKGYAEFLYNIGTFGFAGSTSISLLKGVFLQYFFEVNYFENFGTLDLASIAIVSSYLLIFTGTETTKMLLDVIVRANGVEVKSPGAA